MSACLPTHESSRQQALDRYEILDTSPEQAFDDITKLAAYVTQSPIALISLVDRNRQWFKSKVGIDATETPRDLAFCAHTILCPDQILIIPDAREDARFSGNKLVTGEPKIRFYLGVPLVTPDNEAIGTLCVIDSVPRTLSADQIDVLTILARQVIAQLELSRLANDLRRSDTNREQHLSELKNHQKKLEALSSKLLESSLLDKLTGVGNRAAFDLRIADEVYRAKRHHFSLSLLIIDVDHFKDYNDQFGHTAGDVALQTVAKSLGRARPCDFLARYGGEEFAVLLPATGYEGAITLAQRLRLCVKQATYAHRNVTVSIGISTLGAESEETAQNLLDCADKAMYLAKQRGRDQVLHFNDLD